MTARLKMQRMADGLLAAGRQIFGLLATAVALLLVGVAIYLAWRAFKLLTSDNLGTSDTAAGIQGLAAAVTLLATLFLAGVTTVYVSIAYKHLRLSGPDVTMKWLLAWGHPYDAERQPITAPIDSLDRQPELPWRKEWMIAVRFVNSGNAETSVVGLSLVPEVGPTVNYPESELPISLAPHSSETLYFDHDYMTSFLGVMRSFTRTKRNPDIRVRAELGDGTRRSSRPVPLSVFQRNDD